MPQGYWCGPVASAFMRPGDPYGDDVLDGRPKLRKEFPPVPATPGLAVEHRASGFRGVVLSMDHESVVVRGQTGLERIFRHASGGFTVDRRPVTLIPIARHVGAGRIPARTASGSIATPLAPARIAAASRIWVEGVHDAELVEKVWGDDLRVEGVVVERLDGLDDIDAAIAAFSPNDFPGPARRLGVLVDHLVPGTKEARIAAEVERRYEGVLVTGTPFVDVWQAIRPKVAGIAAWPIIPMGTPWKEGVCAALGVTDPRAMWKRLLASVTTYADLEPALVGAVEQLIDFVTATP